MIDLKRHQARLDYFCGPKDRDILSRCMRRMNKGRSTYEKPGYVDTRDYIVEMEEEIVDAINYAVMEYRKIFESSPLRANHLALKIRCLIQLLKLPG